MLYFRNDDLLLFVSHRWVKHEMRVERVTIRPYVSKKKKRRISLRTSIGYVLVVSLSEFGCKENGRTTGRARGRIATAICQTAVHECHV